MLRNTSSSVFVTLAATSSMLVGCEAIETIFKAGVWVGVIGVAIVLMLVLGLMRMLRGS